MAWDTEEFSALLDWMKAYNQKVPDERKVRFYGTDVLSAKGVGREKVLAYTKYAPEKVSATDSLFRVLAGEGVKWPARLNQKVLQATYMPLNKLVDYFTTNKNNLIAASSLEEWKQTFKHLEAMQQGLYVNVEGISAALASKKLERDEYQAQNLLYIMGNERPDTRFIVWQHNGHISNRPERKTLGYNLQQRLGNGYYGIGFKCYKGTFQARVLMVPRHESVGC